MSEMNTKEIAEYLQQATELEASVYRQTEIIGRAKKALKMDLPKFQKPVEPKLKTYDHPKRKFAKNNDKDPGTVGYITGFIMVLLSFLFLYLELIELFSVLFLLGILFIYWSFNDSKKWNEDISSYKLKMVEYERNTAQAEHKYQTELQAYEAEKAAYDEAYHSHMSLAKKKFQVASGEVSQMEQSLAETQDLLQRLYAVDVIFPKYRSLVPISIMCEYFLTGRCTELTGPNGAYNLYEAELRQNLIINKLDQIVENLEAIRDSQYMLYSELRTLNKTASDISADIRDLCDTAKDIESSARLTANCAEITAKNTEALKYITLING